MVLGAGTLVLLSRISMQPTLSPISKSKQAIRVFTYLLGVIVQNCIFAISESESLLFNRDRLVDPIEMRWAWADVEGLIDPVNLRCFEIDGDGTLWLGYDKGVVSFDGVRQREYPEMKSRGQRSIFASSDGRIFVTGWNRVWRFDGDNWFRYKRVLKMPSPSDMSVREDPSKRLWIAANSRLGELGSDDIQFSRMLASDPIADFAIDASGDFWLVESPSGTIRRVRLLEGRFREIASWEGVMAASDGVSHAVHDIAVASDGSIWVANAHRDVPPHQFSPESEQWRPHDLEAIGGTNLSGEISETRDGLLRITGSGAIHRFDGMRWTFTHDRRLGGSRSWSYLREAEDGVLWLLERFVGLSRIDYQGKKWRQYDDLLYQTRSIDGRLWFLAEGDRVVSSGPEGGSWRSHAAANEMLGTVVGLFARSDGSVWALGTEQDVAVALVWDGESWSKRMFPELGASLHGRLAAEDSEGTLFLGGRPSSNRGIEPREQFVALVPAGGREPILMASVGGRVLQRMNSLPDGRVAVASEDLFVWNGVAFASLLGGARADLTFRDITGFSVGPSGEIWVSSWKPGIARLDGNEWQYFSQKEGLTSGYIADMVRGLDGYPVALTYRGLARFDGRQWHSVDIFHADGVPANSRIDLREDGVIWLGFDGRNGKRFRPKAILDRFPMLQSLRYTSSSEAPDTRIVSISRQDQFSRSAWVSWSGRDPWFETPSTDLLYSYRIDGGEWALFSEDRGVLLNDLEVGARRIEVRAMDRDGKIDLTPAVSTFEVRLLFWETGWFTVASIAIGVAMFSLLGGLLLQRIRHFAALDRMRSRFITNVSHELRSPLTLVLAPLEKMASRADPKSPEGGEIALALRNASRLEQLIDQLLELRKLEDDSPTSRLESIDLVECVGQIVEDLDRIAQTAGQRVGFEVNVEVAWLCVDKDALRKIVDNLVLNALKHSGEGSVTSVCLSIGQATNEDRRDVEIKVEDEGSGIPPEAQPHIFDPFFSGKEGGLLKMRSFGIGLALVKELVGNFEGTVGVESPVNPSDKNGGARFTVWLPSLEFLPSAEKGRDKDVSEVYAPILSEDSGEAKPLLLLVEDQEDILQFLAGELSADFEIIEARDGQEGLSLAVKEVPDVILSDVMMSGLSGIELCNEIRDTEAARHIPVILQTAFGDKVWLSKAMKAGAVDFVQKPFSIEDLRSKLSNLVRSRRDFAKRLRVQLMTSSLSEEESADKVFVDKVKALIHRNLANLEFTANSLGQELGLSRTSCYRKCKAVLGMTPSELIKRYRFDMSISLMSKGKTAAETGFLVGYSEPSAFHRAFKNHFGCTPSDYRKARKGEKGVVVDLGQLE